MPFAEEMLASEVAARATLSPDEVGATGLLRATAPASLGRQVIIPLLPKLFADNPHLRVELNLTERLVDVVGEGLDVAIRIADLRESNLITRRVGTLRRLLCASPEYLARRGRPNSVADLADHDCLTLVGTSHWTFVRNGKQERMKVAGPMSSTTIDGLHAACLYGLGISMHATWSVSDDLKAGRLVELELDAPPYAPAISALFPSSRMVAPKLRVFLSAITAALLHEA
jgi:DNA-binding transcriptional LysR family regulator